MSDTTVFLCPIFLLATAFELTLREHTLSTFFTNKVRYFSELVVVGNVVFKLSSRFKGNGIYHKVIMKPLLSRVKCVCLQNLNKKIGVLYKKSDADTFRQSVQKVFSFFASNLLENYSKI